jgi:hypothetical protein
MSINTTHQPVPEHVYELAGIVSQPGELVVGQAKVLAQLERELVQVSPWTDCERARERARLMRNGTPS